NVRYKLFAVLSSGGFCFFPTGGEGEGPEEKYGRDKKREAFLRIMLWNLICCDKILRLIMECCNNLKGEK
ncbi:MAG: hypothetical protein Q4D58_04820, partial [Synergistaceae bacterium]|nr:hypothetical protein [Synergistaceae bacterium]